jgi:glycosyltransferase involved in cell wall biosynthesis
MVQQNLLKSQPRVLFISHSATRTGAPILFLSFIKWFKENVGWPFDIMLPSGGELVPDFSAVGPTIVLDQLDWGQSSISRRVMKRLGMGLSDSDMLSRAVIQHFSNSIPSLIYTNTVVNLHELTLLEPLNVPVICHAHELETVFALWYPKGAGQFLSMVDRFIAGSHAVRRGLINSQGVSPDKIDVVHEFIPVPDAVQSNARDYRQEVRSEMGLPTDALIVGAVGTLGWRKGSDLFLQLCAEVRRLAPQLPVYFVWIGNLPAQAYVEMMYDVTRSSENGRVIVTGIKADCKPYYEAFDVFTLTSREDPFPLVCLDAAAASKPVLCFDQAGGMPEFVEQDIGFVIPYLEVKMMAERIVQLLTDHSLRERMGRAAREKVLARNDISVGAPKILQIMKLTMGFAGA